MPRVLLVDNSARDAKRLSELLAKEGVELESCPSGIEADDLLSTNSEELSVAIILWELPGAISGTDLLIKCRKLRPEMPVVVTSELLDFSLASRAHGFGARKFLLKPFDSQEFLECIHSLLTPDDPLSPLIQKLREEILGQSPAIIATLQKVAQVIPHKDVRVLLLGETGTGKELFAKAIHKFGPRASQPWVTVDLNSIPATLMESALFGHEKGAFTGAIMQRRGYFEEAAGGTMFLDEIGKLDPSVQDKLLRTLEEKRFRRVGGARDLAFDARLVCATSKDLASAITERTFARDLFHRIAQVVVHVPPLRQRGGDIDLLVDHFLETYRRDNEDERQLRFSPSALAIVRTYPLEGNIRELKNLVYAACINSKSSQITDLPMDDLSMLDASKKTRAGASSPVGENGSSGRQDGLLQELLIHLPINWIELKYHEAAKLFNRAFDRVYLKRKIEQSHYNISKAARTAGIDAKTLRKRWKDSGLPPLSSEDTDAD